MSEYAPPSGPPPPRVPAGWKALWNDQYHEWFYVNTYTKASQWDRPTDAARPHSSNGPPSGPPPNYDHGSHRPPPPEKGGLGSNNPYSHESDEAMARRLQEQENARGSGPGQSSRGESDGYYSGASYGQGPPGGQPPQYGTPSPQPGQDAGKRGFLSKLQGKMGGGSSGSRPPQQGYGGYGSPPPGQYGGGYQHQQGYGNYPPQQGYGGYPSQATAGIPPPAQASYVQQQQQQPQKKGGIGALGGGALGLGAGLLGGALIGEAVEHHEDENRYGDDGGDDGGYGGDDGGYGGGDDGGGGDW